MKKGILCFILLSLLMLWTCSALTESASGSITGPEDMKGRRMGIVSGTSYEPITLQYFPDSEFSYYTSNDDVISALVKNTIDGFLCDEPVIHMMSKTVPEITYLPERLTQDDFAFGFGKNRERADKLREQFNEMLAEIMTDGTLTAMISKWFGDDEAAKEVNLSDFSGENGTLKVVTTSSNIPFSYIKDGKKAGISIELVEMFCRRYGYTPSIDDVDAADCIPGIVSGKYDMCASPLTITEDRSESISFSTPYCRSGIVLTVRKADAPASPAKAEKTFTGIDQLNSPDATLGLPASGAFDAAVSRQLSKAKVTHYNDDLLAYMDVAGGRIDAYVDDEIKLKASLEKGVKGVRILDQYTDETLKMCMRISPVSNIPDLKNKVNSFIKEMKEKGTIEDMRRRWTSENERRMPEIELPKDPQVHLVVAASGAVKPYSYYEGTELTGFDIEMAYRFAQWLGADVTFKVYDYDTIINAALSGEADLLIANPQYTDERAESGLIFSDELYTTHLAVLVRDEEKIASVPEQKTPSVLDALNGKRIGAQTGTNMDTMVLEIMPDAQISYYNTSSDLAAALAADKIDSFPVDNAVLRMMMAENDSLAPYSNDLLDHYEVCYILPKSEKGDALTKQLNTWLQSITDSGELEQINKKWIDGKESEKTVSDYKALPAVNGTLTLATEAFYAPFMYYRDGEIVGMELDLTSRFCEAYGYALEIIDMNFDSVLVSVTQGKADFAAAGIIYTDERAESVNFSLPYYIGGTIMAVLKQNSLVANTQETSTPSIWDGIASSFEKTFIRENRWQLFIDGIKTTLLITVLSILFGTALGFLIFMLCRNGNVFANGVTKFVLWLVQGMPMVVLLMILYYIVFGSVSVNGIFVAVIGFTLTFGGSVFSLLRMGVGTIEVGQYEAAYALGYSNRHTFFRIILPQALPHILPSYKGEIVSLIKATAIVGYIAVQDLTKMGDIVRSRTYEAFFPLIAVTVIYFLLEGLLGFLVSKIQIRMNPKLRKPETILKGVNVHD